MRDDILERKIARLVVALADELKVSEDKALSIFYSTETYRQLSDPATGLRLMSDGYILDDLRAQKVI